MLTRSGPLRASLRRWLKPSVSRLSLMMGACGFVFIVLTAAFTANHEREGDFREARERAQSAVFSLADHAARLFEVADLALRTTTLAAGQQGWDAIETSRPLWDEMHAIADTLPYVGDLWLNDTTGRLRLTTAGFPTPPSNVADRPAFRDVRDGATGLVVGDPLVGRITGQPTFLIARRLQDTDGAFRGMVSATADLHYFTDYWSQRDLPYREQVALIRPERGAVLASFPDGSTNRSDIDMPALRAALAAHPVSGHYEPKPGLSSYYHQVGTLPLYVAVMLSEAAVERDWRAWLWTSSLIPLAAIVLLAGIMVIARRQSLVEALASRDVARARAQLGILNRSLEQRVAERTADLEESNAEIQRFAYIVSHDLRAPLVNIMGFTSELQRLRPALFDPPDADRPSDRDALREDFDEAIGFIQSSIDKMDRLIKAILLLARQGGRVFTPEPIDMEAMMRSIADDVAHRLQSAGAEIAIGPLPDLVLDRMAVEQVFSNLIDNAVKYLRPGVPGEIRVSGEIVAQRAAIRVSDNGRGIEARDHARVFELFRRSGPQDRPGEGIGLAHVRALVRQLGGTIALESRPGQGSTFTVSLPTEPEASRLEPPPDPTSGDAPAPLSPDALGTPR